ncbi:YitT family protein [uncultured Aquincola sp.]|uniref:YitT family protein n=1 Tax=uncultured Aquincola sp. TaxID=886556 RepID=UPI0032B1D720|tara:strand:+ start:342 stop:989 length:648 start_codon:yes stop_codon:yes gene_type:complete
MSSPTPAALPARPATTPIERVPHSVQEDLVALFTGCFVIAFGVMLLQQSHAVTGGTAGLAFLLHYATGLSFGVAFFLLNLPFYYLAWRRMGRAMVLKTFGCVALLSVCTDLHPRFVSIAQISPFYAALLGNMLMGLGFIVLFRHKASLGGLNLLALYLQERHGIRAGHVQMAIDLLIILASTALVPWPSIVASVGGAVVLNLLIAMNHRPDRYLA